MIGLYAVWYVVQEMVSSSLAILLKGPRGSCSPPGILKYANLNCQKGIGKFRKGAENTGPPNKMGPGSPLIVMMARGPGLSTQFPHLMLIITQPIGTVEEVNNKHGPSITVPSVGGDQDQGNAPNISVGDQEPSHQLFTQHQ